ncbi:MAG: YfhO family protein, partial [Flavobacterium sp.]
CFGILLILFFCKGMFSFSGPSDAVFEKNFGPDFIAALKKDRMTLYSADLLRSAFFILLAAVVLWLAVKDFFVQRTAVILVGLFMVFDLFFVDKKYVSGKDFVSKYEVEVPFQETPVDNQILKDTSNYRVFEVANVMGSRTSYFHKSIGGYSAVRPRRMQQLLDYQIAQNNIEVLNMLNVLYVIQKDEKDNDFVAANPDANGNAWFVSQVKKVSSPDEEMKALRNLNSKEVAVINHKEFQLPTTTFTKNSSASITLSSYKPNDLRYKSVNTNDGLAVFSEMYYADGWNAYIDSKKVDHVRVNYTLRGLLIPKGSHTIEFKFEPQVVKTGSTIALISTIGIVILVIGGIYFERKKMSATTK